MLEGAGLEEVGESGVDLGRAGGGGLTGLAGLLWRRALGGRYGWNCGGAAPRVGVVTGVGVGGPSVIAGVGVGVGLKCGCNECDEYGRKEGISLT